MGMDPASMGAMGAPPGDPAQARVGGLREELEAARDAGAEARFDAFTSLAFAAEQAVRPRLGVPPPPLPPAGRARGGSPPPASRLPPPPASPRRRPLPGAGG